MRKAGLFMFMLIGFAFVGLGVLYLVTDEFMPYHSDAIQSTWRNLDSNYQGMFLGFLKGFGSGAFTVGMSIVAMAAFSLKRNDSIYLYLLPGITIVYTCLISYGTYVVYTTTPAEPPIQVGFVLIAISLVAAVLLWTGKQSKGEA